MEVNFKKYWRKTSLKKTEDGIFLLKHIINKKPSILEIYERFILARRKYRLDLFKQLFIG